MDKDTYDKINEYCTTKYKEGRLTSVEKDYVLRKFLNNYYDAVDKHMKSNDDSIDDEQKQLIINTILTDNNMSMYIESAKRNYEEIRASIESDIKKKLGKSNFLTSIGASLLANVIYAVLLIFIFWVAQDQIQTWLITLTTK